MGTLPHFVDSSRLLETQLARTVLAEWLTAKAWPIFGFLACLVPAVSCLFWLGQPVSADKPLTGSVGNALSVAPSATAKPTAGIELPQTTLPSPSASMTLSKKSAFERDLQRARAGDRPAALNAFKLVRDCLARDEWIRSLQSMPFDPARQVVLEATVKKRAEEAEPCKFATPLIERELIPLLMSGAEEGLGGMAVALLQIGPGREGPTSIETDPEVQAWQHNQIRLLKKAVMISGDTGALTHLMGLLEGSGAPLTDRLAYGIVEARVWAQNPTRRETAMRRAQALQTQVQALAADDQRAVDSVLSTLTHGALQ